MSNPLVILVVEDDQRDFTEHYERKLLAYDGITLVHTRTSAEARVKLDKLGFAHFDAVVLDGIIDAELTEIPPRNPTTAPLASEIKAAWDALTDSKERLLVAASSSSAMRKLLVEAGCNREGEKATIATLIAMHFKIV